MVKYMAWAERNPGFPCPPIWDEAVRDTADVQIDPKYPVEAWFSGNRTGGSITVTPESFPGAKPVWYWQA